MDLQSGEYVVTYACKQFLLSKGWQLVAYNPPGSQGTFTIPNPAKDGGYRGQTGSESPDIIAVKSPYVLLIEAKPRFSVSDADKLVRLVDNPSRLALLQEILVRTCAANNVRLAGNPEFLTALAYQGIANQSVTHASFLVGVSTKLDLRNMVAADSYDNFLSVRFIPAEGWIPALSRLFE